MRGEGVLASTWWIGRCALTGSPERWKGPSRGWKKMCLLIYIYSYDVACIGNPSFSP
jgi:hypothetical protein